jgi:MobA/MobL family
VLKVRSVPYHRCLTPEGFSEKARELDQKTSGEVERWRGRWSELQNLALEQVNVAERVDNRSLVRQGIDHEPTKRMVSRRQRPWSAAPNGSPHDRCAPTSR